MRVVLADPSAGVRAFSAGDRPFLCNFRRLKTNLLFAEKACLASPIVPQDVVPLCPASTNRSFSLRFAKRCGVQRNGRPLLSRPSLRPVSESNRPIPPWRVPGLLIPVHGRSANGSRKIPRSARAGYRLYGRLDALAQAAARGLFCKNNKILCFGRSYSACAPQTSGHVTKQLNRVTSRAAVRGLQ